ncbi:MAG: tRNA (guanosine(37)-N1)-methyltransferase TrmD [Candidatus Niyogibacteria bacterium CG10_big_fil_rev_8_21_14_0_10_42_19]|uniref:tRNA (guanine-N(1)-)-methyltransferase n=1 Tax=Candidatus Niyogibacteria bacterium CG10_big_fil_rev_8_21_14_0_10_42_19 TaxID=1974725 RepID=A0A2H0TFY0_9BACT|nr:MAG: tRNA (guanosine(37)-N1)-methyltransferase TrmD [Candidatus Niyogibacteria bacterium CG10_big_fil_rev_8_21_14_0_10_42_19]
MRFDIITIFPDIFDSYFNESMIKRAREKRAVDIRVHNLREYSKDKHKKVDDRPYGGGPGMVLRIDPLTRALSSILRISNSRFLISNKRTNSKFKKQRTKIILFSPSGKQFDSKTAQNFAKKYERIIMICGHYEGVDERIKKVVSDFGFRISDLSIGPYILTGGEIPSMVVVDTVARHIPGVLGRGESLEENRLGVGVPMYTRPDIFEYKKKKYKVPKVLLSGDHKKINEWRRGHKK